MYTAFFSVWWQGNRMKPLFCKQRSFWRNFTSKFDIHRKSISKEKKDNLPISGRKSNSDESNSKESKCNFVIESQMSGRSSSICSAALSYSSIPGPTPMPIIGNLFVFCRFGRYPLYSYYWKACKKLYEDYGPIVRVSKVTPKLDILFLFSPEELEALFKAEGSMPYRPEIEILSFYRKNRPQWFNSVGLVAGNGSEWKRLRGAVAGLLKPKYVSRYKEPQCKVAEKLVTVIGQLGKSYHLPEGDFMIEDMMPLLLRYTMDCVSVITFGKSLGCLGMPHHVHEDAKKIIQGNDDTLTAMADSIYSLPLFKWLPSTNYRKLERAQDSLKKLVDLKLEQMYEEYRTKTDDFNERNPIVANLFHSNELSHEDLLLMLIEIFQGGIDATAATLGFSLYFLSKNEEVQRKLFLEVENIDAKYHSLQNLPILKSTVRETLRLRPSAAAVGRILQHNMIIRGYEVPAGTLVSGPPLISCRDEKHFHEAHSFMPERWIKTLPFNSQITEASSAQMCAAKASRYASLPFGHGARMCPGRRIAEQEIYLAIIEMVKHYEMKLDESSYGGHAGRFSEENGGYEEDCNLGQVMRLNMVPSGPIAIRFRLRKQG